MRQFPRDRPTLRLLRDPRKTNQCPQCRSHPSPALRKFFAKSQILDVSWNPGTGRGPPTRGKLASEQSSMPELGVGQVPSACPCRQSQCGIQCLAPASQHAGWLNRRPLPQRLQTKSPRTETSHHHSGRPTPLPSRNIRACRFRCLLHIPPAQVDSRLPASQHVEIGEAATSALCQQCPLARSSLGTGSRLHGVAHGVGGGPGLPLARGFPRAAEPSSRSP
mmetsp:Transcript_93612/g.222558  ORF Transcript_93612/g.222558 Transcript_93612/m.222558 type:complete len:221 (+) Transcript_93612:243-905(+)